MCLPISRLFWVSSLAYPNLLGTKGYIVVVVVVVLDGIQYLSGQYNPSSHVDMLNVLVSTCFSSSHDFSFRICQFSVFSNSQYLLLVLIGSSLLLVLIGSSHFSVSLSICQFSVFSMSRYMSLVLISSSHFPSICQFQCSVFFSNI
jgi:hypothetical protein